jgi:glycosyltransferase involved in cell wall biosynthesis
MTPGKLHVGDQPRIVFYRTQHFDERSQHGSALRPAKLLGAFRRLGYEVDVVAGPADERQAAMSKVRQNLAQGVHYDFLYAEPPTTPITLNESHHLPTHPFLDYGFLSWWRSRRIPVVLFYCDVQWRLPDYPRRIGLHKYLYMLPFFHLDLAVYRRVVDVLLVPNVGMLTQIPSWPDGKPARESIPGFDDSEELPRRGPRSASGALRLFYVGGVEPPVYDLTPVLEGITFARAQSLPLELTICAREPEWRRHHGAYARWLGPHVRIVHNRTRQELLELYANHDIAVMPYGTLNSDWAMPVKFAEAVGAEVPLLAGAGTAVGIRVAAERTGWVVEPGEGGLWNALSSVGEAELERARAAVISVRPAYSWTRRAEEIAAIAAATRSGQATVRPT